MFPLSPVTKTEQGVVEHTHPSGAVEATQGVERVKPVAEQPIETDELRDALRQERERENSETEEKTSSEAEKGLRSRMEVLENAAQSYGHKLSFELDVDTGDMIVQVKDAEGEVIRQIPPKEFIQLFSRLDELRGALFDRFA